MHAPAKYVELFTTVRDARNAAVKFVRDRFAAKQKVQGWEAFRGQTQVVFSLRDGESRKPSFG
jgi:hypothetical protein